MIALANHLINQISEAPTIKLFGLLKEKNKIKNSEMLIRGQYSLQSVYTFGAGDVFQLGSKIFAILADYKHSAGFNYTKMIIQYPDVQDARLAFGNLVTNLDSYLTVLKSTEALLKFKDYRGQFGCVKLIKNVMLLTFKFQTESKICD